jgi:hypothetical protein
MGSIEHRRRHGDIRDSYEVQELDKFTINLRINFEYNRIVPRKIKV